MLTPIFDSHTHSENSPDGRHTLSRMCETACDKGLMGFAITDHCDFNQFEEENFQNRCFLSRYHAKKSRVGFAGQIKLITGVEIGQPLEVPDISEPFIDRYAEEYDFYLCSLHNNIGREDFYFLDYDALSAGQLRQLLEEYFSQVTDIVRWNKFDSLAHLTYPLRYLVGSQHAPLDLAPYRGQMEELLGLLSQNGKALEINTSGLRQNMGETMPNLEVLKLFRKLGGQYVTVGSDAHTVDVMADGFDVAFGMLKEAGYDRYYYYEKHQPVPIEILD